MWNGTRRRQLNGAGDALQVELWVPECNTKGGSSLALVIVPKGVEFEKSDKADHLTAKLDLRGAE